MSSSFTENLKMLSLVVISKQPGMFMASNRCLTSRNDIRLGVVFQFCVRLRISLVENIKQIQNTSADRAYDTELEIDLLGFSLLS